MKNNNSEAGINYPILYLTNFLLFMRTVITSLKYAPFYLTGGYVLLVILDIITTYIASPDLKYEGNLFVRYFHLGWKQIIFFYSLQTVFALILFSLSRNYILTYYMINNGGDQKSFLYEASHKMKLLLGFFFYGWFIKQFFYTIFVVINNYLGYIYIFKVENFITAFSTWFRNIEISTYPFFFPVIEIFFIFIITCYTIYWGSQIKRKYQNRPDF